MWHFEIKYQIIWGGGPFWEEFYTFRPDSVGQVEFRATESSLDDKSLLSQIKKLPTSLFKSERLHPSEVYKGLIKYNGHL